MKKRHRCRITTWIADLLDAGNDPAEISTKLRCRFSLVAAVKNELQQTENEERRQGTAKQFLDRANRHVDKCLKKLREADIDEKKRMARKSLDWALEARRTIKNQLPAAIDAEAAAVRRENEETMRRERKYESKNRDRFR